MPPPSLIPLESICNVRLATSDPDSSWNITFDRPNNHDNNDKPLALPTLTHPHIHLDKAFVHSALSSASHLPSTGSFQEALSLTAQAKAGFHRSDLLQRGEWLLAESVASGVTAMRAFVEVDHTVGLTCLDAGVELKTRWEAACQIQLVCFAQDPVFSGEFGDENRALLEEALARYPQVDVIGTTPYVEAGEAAAKRNIDWAAARALELEKHVDFHLDYNLDGGREALVWYVLDALRRNRWTASTTNKRVMLGHCTRLTLFDHEEWSRLAREIHQHDLPVSFVGLPTSDLYMAAPPGAESDNGRPRGTLPVPEMIRKYGLDAVMGVNNVGNAFTPWGSPDPLSLACLGVGVYQTGTQADANLLYECVSTRARTAIGLSSRTSDLVLKHGDCDDVLLFYNVDDTGCGVSRQRTRVADVVWDPPARVSRSVVIRGALKRPPHSVCPDTARSMIEAMYSFCKKQGVTERESL
ncbi:Metallo-dependent hydrolase [Aspergillus steynii IBT 23096]|uniref:Metallo-dependent hydrolase n=1 Tax=Aspergillus steynii IBT 23096 TaxID=1392250 RepID=A0A2I2G1Z1_9EURO|nr:Metallo-dependent hydrolase [Aspergillus steynii IBT 23096]PLB46900.1 Metallo-dependent hydrolase [Aspergillus steynii IBT 23096]